jgi:hypothetical protein
VSFFHYFGILLLAYTLLFLAKLLESMLIIVAGGERSYAAQLPEELTWGPKMLP